MSQEVPVTRAPPFCISGGNSCVWRTAGRVLFLLSYATARLLLLGGTLWCPHLLGEPRIWSTNIFSEYKVFPHYHLCTDDAVWNYLQFFSFKSEYIIISTFIIMMKMIDAVEDVFHGNLQQKYHVEQMGKMLASEKSVFTSFHHM